MPDKCHSLLKDYSNAWDMTMSEVMYEAMRCFVHRHSECCAYINSLVEFRGVIQDKRATKPCYSQACFACKHRTACRAGLYTGMWEMNPELTSFVSTKSDSCNIEYN